MTKKTKSTNKTTTKPSKASQDVIKCIPVKHRKKARKEALKVEHEFKFNPNLQGNSKTALLNRAKAGVDFIAATVGSIAKKPQLKPNATAQEKEVYEVIATLFSKVPIRS